MIWTIFHKCLAIPVEIAEVESLDELDSILRLWKQQAAEYGDDLSVGAQQALNWEWEAYMDADSAVYKMVDGQSGDVLSLQAVSFSSETLDGDRAVAADLILKAVPLFFPNRKVALGRLKGRVTGIAEAQLVHVVWVSRHQNESQGIAISPEIVNEALSWEAEMLGFEARAGLKNLFTKRMSYYQEILNPAANRLLEAWN